MKEIESFISDLRNLIAYKSVESSPTKTCPFGEEVYKAYQYFLSLAKSFGFDVIDYDRYIGEVVYGEGEEIGIIGHLDVVPEGKGWETDPYVLTEKDGYLYGRGICDDKAPLLLCLYALKELKDSKVKFNKKIRLFFGCNEESGWRDIAYLNTKTTLPIYGFSPDGNFPVSYAEKGMSEIFLHLPKPTELLLINGGTVVNVVCNYAFIELNDKKVDNNLLEKLNLSSEQNKIVSLGKACHGSCPKDGKNAIKPLLEYLSIYDKSLSNIIDKIFPKDGIIDGLSSPQGYTTISPNIVCSTDNEIILTCDCRYPAPLTTNDLVPYLDSLKIKYQLKERHPSVCVEREGRFVSSLLNAYNETTNSQGQPISQGGSTFARAFKKGCAFGPEFPGEENNIHQPNERISKVNLLKLYNIYKNALGNLVILTEKLN